MTEPLNPISAYVSYTIAAANRAVHRSIAEKLKKHGVQIEVWRILETLDGGERLTMGRLADIVLINPPTLSKLVDRMVSDGLVHRQVSQSDQRQINLLLTAIGRKRMRQIRAEIQLQDDEIVSQLGPAATQKLVELLRGLT